MYGPCAYGDRGREPVGVDMFLGDRGSDPPKTANAAALVPSFEGWEVLSGEWMRKLLFGPSGKPPYVDSSCVRRFWYLEGGTSGNQRMATTALREKKLASTEEWWYGASRALRPRWHKGRPGQDADVPLFCNIPFLEESQSKSTVSRRFEVHYPDASCVGFRAVTESFKLWLLTSNSLSSSCSLSCKSGARFAAIVS